MTREQWIYGLERQYARRLAQRANARNDMERAGIDQLLDRISEILASLQSVR